MGSGINRKRRLGRGTRINRRQTIKSPTKRRSNDPKVRKLQQKAWETYRANRKSDIENASRTS